MENGANAVVLAGSTGQGINATRCKTTFPVAICNRYPKFVVTENPPAASKFTSSVVKPSDHVAAERITPSSTTSSEFESPASGDSFVAQCGVHTSAKQKP